MSGPAVQQKLQALGIRLPEPTAPVGVFAPFVRTGDLLFLSGHIAKKSGAAWAGSLGASVDVEEGRAAARAAAVDLLGTLQQAAGGLENVGRIVKLGVFVKSAPGFERQPAVADGASEILRDLFGEASARTAVGVSELPLGACVELDLVAELKAR